MNEQILELARQAANGMLSYDAEGEWRLEGKEVEKFAELIVQECAKLADEPTSRPYESYGEKIKKHFGVE